LQPVAEKLLPESDIHRVLILRRSSLTSEYDVRSNSRLRPFR
jgi:hypothetical protein